MQVVHSYIPTVPGEIVPPIIWKELMYGQMLSALLAQREYGNITLYTNKVIAKQIEEIGVPYTHIDTGILEGVVSKSYTYPKMKVFKELTTPYLHIDTDTYIFNKIDFSHTESPVVYAHSDQHVDFQNINSSPGLSQYINNMSRCYTSLFFLHEEEHKDLDPVNVDLFKIPNGNLTCVKDVTLMRNATSRALDYYERHKEVIDRNTYGGVYVEQMLIHLYMMQENPKYRDSVLKNEHFVCDDVFMQFNYSNKDHSVDYLHYKFPVNFKLHTLKDKFLPRVEAYAQAARNAGYRVEKQKYKEYTINNGEELKKLFSDKFTGVLHPTFNKWAPFFECLTIGAIVEQFGEQYVRNVHNFYTTVWDKYKMNVPEMSRGELLYEEITGFKFKEPTVL
jgi:hypothetical protein